MRGRRGGSSWKGSGDEGGREGGLVMEMEMEMGRAGFFWRYMNELGGLVMVRCIMLFPSAWFFWRCWNHPNPTQSGQTERTNKHHFEAHVHL